MRKALFWDFDGTLVYPDSKWLNALHAVLRETAHEVPVEAIRAHLRSGYTWHTPEKIYPDRTGYKWWENLFAHMDSLYQAHSIPMGKRTIVNERFREQILDPVNYTVYEDALEVLQKCVGLGFENYLVSNNFPELADVADKLRLSEYFRGYAVSACIGYEKPRPEIFEYALSLAKAPDFCCMLGDNPVSDIQGGKAAGMKTILVHAKENCGADGFCESLSEIPGILARLEK